MLSGQVKDEGATVLDFDFISSLDPDHGLDLHHHLHHHNGNHQHHHQVPALAMQQPSGRHSPRLSQRAVYGGKPSNPLSLTIKIPVSPTTHARMILGETAGDSPFHDPAGEGVLSDHDGNDHHGQLSISTSTGGGGRRDGAGSRYGTRLKTGTVAPVAHYGQLGYNGGPSSPDDPGSDDDMVNSDPAPPPADAAALAATKKSHKRGVKAGAGAGEVAGVGIGGMIGAGGSSKKRAKRPASKLTPVDEAREAREAELKKAKSVQSARDCRRRKKAFIQSLQLQVKQCEEREANSQQLIAKLEKELLQLRASPALKAAHAAATVANHARATPGVAGARRATKQSSLPSAGSHHHHLGGGGLPGGGRGRVNHTNIPQFLASGGGGCLG